MKSAESEGLSDVLLYRTAYIQRIYINIYYTRNSFSFYCYYYFFFFAPHTKVVLATALQIKKITNLCSQYVHIHTQIYTYIFTYTHRKRDTHTPITKFRKHNKDIYPFGFTTRRYAFQGCTDNATITTYTHTKSNDFKYQNYNPYTNNIYVPHLAAPHVST